jgi:hypothetical protein
MFLMSLPNHLHALHTAYDSKGRYLATSSSHEALFVRSSDLRCVPPPCLIRATAPQFVQLSTSYKSRRELQELEQVQLPRWVVHPHDIM